jgi:hypothetical protein
MSHRATGFIAFAALAAGLALGCGAPPKRAASPAKPARGGSAPASPEAKGAGSRVAEETRNATLVRQGGWKLTSEKVQAVAPLVREAAKRNGLPEDLVFGIIWVESRFDPEAVSPVGARGLMQLMPGTADYLAELIGWKGRHDAFDPEFNIAAGTFYIAKLIGQFGGDVDLALAAYNAGPTKIRRWLAEGWLPRVSIEYHTMVQTARTFFGGTAGGAGGGTWEAPSTEDLDRLGLAVLIAGLSDRQFGLEREDDRTPFN